MKIEFSNHCIEERTERVYEIASTIGFGEIMQYFPGAHEVKAITDTAVLLIMTPNKKKIITLYVVSIAQANIIFKEKEKEKKKKKKKR